MNYIFTGALSYADDIGVRKKWQWKKMAMEQMAMEIMAMEKMAKEIMAICKIWKKWQTYFIL